jgi:hypothetical protein
MMGTDDETTPINNERCARLMGNDRGERRMRGRKTPAGDTEILAQSVLGENINRRRNRLSVDDMSGLIVWGTFIPQAGLRVVTTN